MSSEILYEKEIEGGWNWSHVIRKGTVIRLTDIEGGGNASALFYNAHNFSERYNMGDTLKIQHISFIRENHCIYSDMGRILMSVVKETCGWHDAVCGVSNKKTIEDQFGSKSYQLFQNEFTRNGYDSLLVELAKHGMGRRDFTETINFFSKVAIDADGNLSFVEQFSKAGDYVELHAEMDTLLVLDTGMHSLNTSTRYLQKPIKVTVTACPPATVDDGCRNSCPENQRGFMNTELYTL